MNKLSIFTKMFCVFLCIHTTQSNLAQTKFWGVGAATGQADAQFSNPFVQSTIAGNYSPTEWTALSVYDSNTLVPGNAFWAHSLLGHSQGGYWNGDIINSPSQANGAAIFDSDWMDNNGIMGAYGTGSSPTTHKGELISPRIDLTAAMDSLILVQFYVLYRPSQITELSLSISTDDGTTWGATTNILTLQPTTPHVSTQSWVNAVFPYITTGINNLTQCRIKFTFEGAYYFAIVDDISIGVSPESGYDIAIGVGDTSASSYFERGDIVRISCNRSIASHHIAALNLKEWFWGAKIVNKGYKDILPAAHPRIRINIDCTSSFGGKSYNIYNNTIIGNITDTLKAGDTQGLALIKYFTDINYIDFYSLSSGINHFTVTYWVEQDSIDGLRYNDTVRYYFDVTHSESCNVIGFTSKANLSSDGKVHGSTVFFPEGAPYNSLEYGSVFYFPQGGLNEFKIDSVEFRYHLPIGYSGDSSHVLSVNIYRYQDGIGGNLNGFLESPELTKIGVAPVLLNGLGTTISNGSNVVTTVGGFTDPTTSGSMPALVDNGVYYISIMTNPYLYGGATTFELNDVPILLSDKINYGMNIGMTSSNLPILPSVLVVTDSTGSTILTEFDKVPAIGVHTSYCYSSIDNINAPESMLTLYPNPTTNYLNIQTIFSEQTDVQYIITNILGKVYYIYTNKNISNDIHTVNVAALPAGVYLVSAKTDKGVSTKRFVKD